MREAELRRAGQLQARLCHEHRSPTYGAIIDGLVAALDHGRRVVAVDLLVRDQRDAVGSALYLRLLGAVHRLAMDDPSCPLGRYYPSVGGQPDPASAAAAFPEVVAANRQYVEREMQRDVQTNDVGRIAPLGAAMRYAVKGFGGPVQLLEPGASAGLNLWPDRYRVNVNGGWVGPERSALTLSDTFTAGSPPTAALDIVGRRGCDLHPVAISSHRDRQLLRSFVWPDDGARLARLNAALRAATEVTIDRQDACGWIASRLQELRPDVTTIVFHSVLMPYFTSSERERFVRLLRVAGDAADATHRLVWISLEPWPSDTDLALICKTWPGGECLLLARCSPHGNNIRWDPKPLHDDPWRSYPDTQTDLSRISQTGKG